MTVFKLVSRLRVCKSFWLIAAVAALSAGTPQIHAQAEDAAEAGSQSLVNSIADRDWEVRLRFEAQLTEDDDELIGQDVAYAAFPSRMYSAETRISGSASEQFTVQYSWWENEQGLDSARWSWRMKAPLSYEDPVCSRFSVKYNNIKDGSSEWHYLHFSIDRTLPANCYGMLQYRAAWKEGTDYSRQLYTYFSWRPTERFRLSEQAALSQAVEDGDLYPWYCDLSATFFIVPDQTSLQLKGRHYVSSEDLAYQEFNAMVYQRVGGSSWLRINTRFYQDDDGRESWAAGVKAKHYFHERFSAHVGYRFYDHSEDADFDTVYAGLEALL